ncbi:bestrophin-like domain [Trinickia sp. YCB016]
MNNITNYPVLVFAISLVLQWGSARIGTVLTKRRGDMGADAREDFGVIQAATLTLLALIIGFSFSMATSRYDLRKSYEENEANAIGTEYVRADLLPPAQAATVRALLARYTDVRIHYYQTRDAQQLQQINTATAQLQNGLWSAVSASAAQQPTPVMALAVSGMNDVLNTQGYTQAEWWNRLPLAAWVLMLLMAVCANTLVGYGMRTNNGKKLLVVLPIVVSIAFMLIADIDSPRGGVIRVKPQNLMAFAQSLPSH